MAEGFSAGGNVVSLDEERGKRKAAAERSESVFIGTLKSIVPFLINGVWVWFTDSKGQPGVSGQVQSVASDYRSVTVRTDSGKIETVQVGSFKHGQQVDFMSGKRKQN